MTHLSGSETANEQSMSLPSNPNAIIQLLRTPQSNSVAPLRYDALIEERDPSPYNSSLTHSLTHSTLTGWLNNISSIHAYTIHTVAKKKEKEIPVESIVLKLIKVPLISIYPSNSNRSDKRME